MTPLTHEPNEVIRAIDQIARDTRLHAQIIPEHFREQEATWEEVTGLAHAHLIDILVDSPLADIPQFLISVEQVQMVLAGLPVAPTPLQRQIALRINSVFGEMAARRPLQQRRLIGELR